MSLRFTWGFFIGKSKRGGTAGADTQPSSPNAEWKIHFVFEDEGFLLADEIRRLRDWEIDLLISTLQSLFAG